MTMLADLKLMPDTSKWPKCRSCEERAHPAAMDGLCFACTDHRAEERDQAAEKRDRLRDTRIPERFTWASIDAPSLRERVKSKAAIDQARSWAGDSKRDRLVLVGAAGSGKTSIASAVLRRVVFASGLRGLFVDALELGQARRNARLGAEAPLVARAVEADVLVLDDLAQEPKDPMGAVAYVIHQRHAACRATVITTFATPRLIADAYGAGTGRRVFEGSLVVRCDL